MQIRKKSNPVALLPYQLVRVNRIGRANDVVHIPPAIEQKHRYCSSMGAGNKMDASAFQVADISKTSVCPLAKVMRRELRKRGIKKLKVVYSTEPPIEPKETEELSCKNHCVCPPGTARKCTVRRQIPGSTAFVPSVAGLMIAGEVVKDLIKDVR